MVLLGNTCIGNLKKGYKMMTIKKKKVQVGNDDTFGF